MNYIKVIVSLLILSVSGFSSAEIKSTNNISAKSFTQSIHFSKTRGFDNVGSLIKGADLIVVGRAVNRQSTYLVPFVKDIDEDRKDEILDKMKVLYTHIDVDVYDVIKGKQSLMGTVLRVMQPGGDMGENEMSVIAIGVPRLEIGEDYVLFLTAYIDGEGNKTGRFVVTGLNDGILSVKEGMNLKVPTGSHSKIELGELFNTLGKIRGAVIGREVIVPH